MALTRFPFETDQPQVQVTLPPGRHVLQLVVEDSTGQRSAPAQVVVTIQQVQPSPTPDTHPAITGFRPADARPGSRIEFVIEGKNLQGTEALRFLWAEVPRGGDLPTLELDWQPDETIKAEIVEVVAEQVVALVQIAANAPLGGRRFVLKTPAGEVESPEELFLRIVAETPTIRPTSILPTRIIPTGITPTSIIPTTILPTTILPTTILPTTVLPTTVLPTTIVPTRILPTTVLPTTVAPIDPTTVPVLPTSLDPIGPGHPVISGAEAPGSQPVTEVHGVGETYGARLSAAGITTAAALAALEPGRAATILESSEVRAMKLIEAARDMLDE